MTKASLIATGIAVGTIAALFAIPKTRKLITNAASDLGSSIKNLAGHELKANGKALVNS